MKGESWRLLPSTENRYAISNFGRVRNARTLRVLKPIEKHRGGRVVVMGDGIVGTYSDKDYHQVSIYAETGVLRVKLIHRLMAEVWLPPSPTSKHVINHRDGDKHNNRRTNLEWATSKKNSQHAIATGLRQKKGTSSNRLTAAQAVFIHTRAPWLPGDAARYAAEFGVSIRAIWHRRQKVEPIIED